MNRVDEKLAKSLTAETTELIPYLPYLLQDIGELGAIPADMLELLSRYTNVSADAEILDLACGKGAVSLYLAEMLGCRVKGIDLMADFIDLARRSAKESHLEHRCRFAVGDANEAVLAERGYDVVIFAAAGDVLGTPAETIAALKGTIKPNGFILLDDAYVEPDAALEYYTRADWMSAFDKTSVRLLGEKGCDAETMHRLNQDNQAKIIRRANELSKAYPENKSLFAGYVQSQQAECDDLAGDLKAVTWLLQAQ